MNKPKIGITIGDINGIGPEIIIKTFSNPKILDLCTPIIYGSAKVLAYYKNIVEAENFSFVSCSNASKAQAGKINVVNCWQENVLVSLGVLNEQGGKCAYMALDRAVDECKKKMVNAIVTAPINKKAMQMANFNHPGHTEFLAEETDAKDYLMMMVSDSLRVGLLSAHVPLAQAAEQVNKEALKSKIKIFMQSLIKDFGIDKPKIAILGLNPHAGDGGVIGSEEEEVIRPVIIEMKKAGHIVMGPYSADGFFGSKSYSKFDGILAMYHDQGLVGFKSLSFGEGVNFSAGMSLVRTSPDHGTGFDIAGKNMADESSFRKALFLAIDIARNRFSYEDMRKNQLRKKPISSEEVSE